MSRNTVNISLYNLLFIFLFSCSHPRENMQINIAVQSNPEKQIVSLIGKDYGEQAILLDTVTLKAGNSTCTFELLNSSESIYSIRFEKENRYILFSNDVTPINISVNWNNFPAYTVSSPASNSLKNLLVTYNQYLTEKSGVGVDSTQALTDSMRNVLQQQSIAKNQKSLDYLSRYTDTAQSPAVALYALGILQQRSNDSVTMKPLIKKLATRFSQDPNITKLNTDYSSWLNAQKAKPEVLKAAPIFSLPDTSGQMISLQSFHGKYVLVDFWASWCPICRKENPNVVEAFNLYKNKNFTILGVSLDSTKKAWVNAIHTDKLNWQHVSDLKFWKSSVVDLYKIEALPYNVLLDPEGKIIASDLRGPALQQKLAEVLK